MDTEKISALIKALELGSLSAAAEVLGYTPSGISRMMASLEAEAGFPLLIRSREGLRPTRECETLLPHFHMLADEAKRTGHIVNALRGIECGSLYVGTPYPAFIQTLSRLMAAFSEQHPSIHIGLLEGVSSELAGRVSRREADFCIISRRDGDFDWKPMTNDPLVALVAPGHPLTEQGYVSADDLRREPFIQLYPQDETDCSRYLEENCVEPNVRFSCRDIYAVYHMVGAGLGITVDNRISASAMQDIVRILPVRPAKSIEIGIAFPRKAQLSPAAQAFLKMSESFFHPL